MSCSSVGPFQGAVLQEHHRSPMGSHILPRICYMVGFPWGHTFPQAIACFSRTSPWAAGGSLHSCGSHGLRGTAALPWAAPRAAEGPQLWHLSTSGPSFPSDPGVCRAVLLTPPLPLLSLQLLLGRFLSSFLNLPQPRRCCHHCWLPWLCQTREALSRFSQEPPCSPSAVTRPTPLPLPTFFPIPIKKEENFFFLIWLRMSLKNNY